MAKKISERIRYGMPAVRIEQDERGVRVRCRPALGAVTTFAADRLICTLSFSVLRTIETHPAFSASKLRAINALPYTSVARVFVQLRERFWLARKEAGAVTTDLPIQEVYDDTATQPGTRGILSSYSVGDRARKMAGFGEGERLAVMVREMEKVHAHVSDFVEGGESKCWDDDSWSRGDYCYFTPGQLTDLGPHLASAEGRVHFAGDHTSRWPGFMQGALESGHRVAREVQQAT